MKRSHEHVFIKHDAMRRVIELLLSILVLMRVLTEGCDSYEKEEGED